MRALASACRTSFGVIPKAGRLNRLPPRRRAGSGPRCPSPLRTSSRSGLSGRRLRPEQLQESGVAGQVLAVAAEDHVRDREERTCSRAVRTELRRAEPARSFDSRHPWQGWDARRVVRASVPVPSRTVHAELSRYERDTDASTVSEGSRSPYHAGGTRPSPRRSPRREWCRGRRSAHGSRPDFEAGQCHAQTNGPGGSDRQARQTPSQQSTRQAHGRRFPGFRACAHALHNGQLRRNEPSSPSSWSPPSQGDAVEPPGPSFEGARDFGALDDRGLDPRVDRTVVGLQQPSICGEPEPGWRGAESLHRVVVGPACASSMTSKVRAIGRGEREAASLLCRAAQHAPGGRFCRQRQRSTPHVPSVGRSVHRRAVLRAGIAGRDAAFGVAAVAGRMFAVRRTVVIVDVTVTALIRVHVSSRPRCAEFAATGASTTTYTRLGGVLAVDVRERRRAERAAAVLGVARTRIAAVGLIKNRIGAPLAKLGPRVRPSRCCCPPRRARQEVRTVLGVLVARSAAVVDELVAAPSLL